MRALRKAVALMTAAYLVGCSVLPVCVIWQDEVQSQMLSRMEALPESTAVVTNGEIIYRCRGPDYCCSTGTENVMRFMVNVGYRIRDETL